MSRVTQKKNGWLSPRVGLLISLLVVSGLGCSRTGNNAEEVDPAGSPQDEGDLVDYGSQTPEEPTVAEPTTPDSPPGKLIMIAVDGFHPDYLTLDRHGEKGGSDGNWLVPNLRRFLDKATWYKNARSFLPSATDMNHLNALAGTNSGQTGLLGVSSEVWGWDAEGKPVIAPPHVSKMRDSNGDAVDTLFHAWKRSWPASKTAFVSGKGWVAENYRTDPPIVDFIVHGEAPMDYMSIPASESFADPPSDDDAKCDPESIRQLELALLMEAAPAKAPPDSWVVESSLALYERESPDMAYILLGQMDDLGHALGAAHDPEEFVTRNFPYRPPLMCSDDPKYQEVSARDQQIYREPILDGVRAVDLQVGRLLDGLEAQGVLQNATVVLLSDHSMVSHLNSFQFAPNSTDYMKILADAGLDGTDNIIPYSATSFALLYYHNSKGQVPLAKRILEAHRATNPQTGVQECPWWVLDRADMKNGKPGVSLPGELYNTYFIETDQEQTKIWPDLMIFARDGFQIPAYDGMLTNLGIELPIDIGALTPFIGGHGSVDTTPILMAFSHPGGQSVVSEHPARIADIATTIADAFGLSLRSVTVGKILSF